MIIGRTLKTNNYICKGDDENPTKFLLKTLSAMDVAEFQDGLMSEGKATFSVTSMYELLKKALVGWENFQGEDDLPIKFNPKDANANLDKLPASIIMELCEEVMRSNFPDPEGNLEKN